MNLPLRNQLLAVSLLVVGMVLLYQPRYHLLHGIALASLLIGSLILLKLSAAASQVLGVLTLLVGLVFLFWPTGSLLRGSATSLLFMGALLLPVSCPAAWKQVVGWTGVGIVLVGGMALYGVFGQEMHARALLLMLVGTLAFSVALPQVRWVEQTAMGLIVTGLVFLCQPFVLVLYQTGFQILIAGTAAFIVVAHRL